MRALIHCPWCSSRTTFDTDGDGGLVGRLNHPCHCPPRTFHPEPEELPGECVDCGKAVRLHAIRCARCTGINDKRLRRESTARKRADRRAMQPHELPFCRCGKRVRHGRAKWCPECRAILDGLSERKKKLMRAGELFA